MLTKSAKLKSPRHRARPLCLPLEPRLLWSSGQLDTSFSSDGLVATGLGGRAAGVAVAVQADHKVVALAQESAGTVGVFRLNADGTFDTSFGPNGSGFENLTPLDHPFPGTTGYQPTSIGLGPNNTIVIAGDTTSGYLFFARLKQDGSYDKSFGNNGESYAFFSSDATLNTIKVQTDGSIIAGGKSGTQGVVARVTNKGSFDPSFETLGFEKVQPAFATSFVVNSVAVESNGTIVAFGTAINSQSTKFAQAYAFNKNGSSDLNFGVDGQLTLDNLIGDASDATGAGVAIDPRNGDFVFGGTWNIPNHSYWYVGRYLPDGSPDPAFSSNSSIASTQIVPQSVSTNAVLNALVVRPDGKIDAVGKTNFDPTVAQLNADGSIDTAYGKSGVSTIFFPLSVETPGDQFTDAALDPNGKLVAVAEVGQSNAVAGVARFTGDPVSTSQTQILGRVFDDKNTDGKYDTGDGTLKGRIVFVDLKKDNHLDAGDPMSTTDSNGIYTLNVPSAGTYRIVTLPPSGWRITTPTLQNVTVTTGQKHTGTDFGQTTTAQVSGTVFADTNSNGKLNSTEKGLSGWTVYIDTNGNGKLDSGEVHVVTNSSGQFTLTLPAGKYKIREVLQSGKKQTAPSGGFYTVTLAAAQVVTGLNFGDH
jgi:uncharacterized delta-60 repeat protein